MLSSFTGIPDLQALSLAPVILAALFVSLALSAYLLGRAHPRWVLAGLLVVVSTTASLAWFLGLGNLSPTVPAVLGFLAATLGTRRSASAPTGKWIRPLAVATAATLVVSGAAGLLRQAVQSPDGAGPADFFAGQMVFTVGGLPGTLQALLIAASGPMLLLATLRLASDRASICFLARAFAVAAIAVFVGIAGQVVMSQPFLRPDHAAVTGIVGLSQDPHSLAAVLLLALGLFLAAASVAWRRGARPWVAAFVAAATLSLVAIVYTNSRGGLLATVLLLAIWVGLLGAQRLQLGEGVRRLRFAATIALFPAVVFAVLFFSPFKALPRQVLEAVGADRMAAVFEVGPGGLDSVRFRLYGWGKAAEIMRQRPIIGTGPRQFVAADVALPEELTRDVHSSVLTENAHNYFLQLGAEYGVLPMVLFAALCLAIVRGLWIGAVSGVKSPESVALPAVFAATISFLAFCTISHPLLIAEVQIQFWVFCGLGISLAGRLVGGESADEMAARAASEFAMARKETEPASKDVRGRPQKST